MKTGKTNVIGFIGGLYTGFCMEIIRGINDVASENNYMVKLLPAKTAEEVQQLVTEFRELGVDGRVATDHLVTGLSRVEGALQGVAAQAANAAGAPSKKARLYMKPPETRKIMRRSAPAGSEPR